MKTIIKFIFSFVVVSVFLTSCAPTTANKETRGNAKGAIAGSAA